MLKTEEQVSLLLRIAQLCRVKEHKRGRLTLKAGITDLPGLSSLINEVPDLEAEIGRIPGYKKHELHVGLTGASVVIDYDPAGFPPDLWDALGMLKTKPGMQQQVAQRLQALFDGTSGVA